MTKLSGVSVSISGMLLSQLRVHAAELEVPVRWLVVGLVCDTVEQIARGCVERVVPNSSLASARRAVDDNLQCARLDN
jgi:hypothetical protein